MRRRKNPAGTARRRGMILLIVLVMLTLFAIAGLTFVLYADASAESARFNRDAETYTNNLPDMNPSDAFDYFLGQLIYGVNDTDTFGPYSALRGHSLAETMYGSYDAGALGPNTPMDQPYNGVGPLHYQYPASPLAVANQDDYSLVNYTYFGNDGNPADGFDRDPGRYGTRASATAARTQPFVGQNAPYTYWDRDSMFLGAIQASTGQVVQQSYYRSSTFDPGNLGLNNTTNLNWTNPQGKYLILRPRPADMNPPGTPPNQGFPYPTDAWGDVKNLPGGLHNDSIWIDIGAPVLSTAAGLKYKMLVAPLVIDLDNRVNLNVVGNILASYGTSGAIHASNQGAGAWEINMGKVLNPASPPAPPNEWKNLFVGGNGVAGRYGAGAGALPLSFFPVQGTAPHPYAPVDFDAVTDPIQGSASLTQPITLPGGNPAVAQFFPFFSPTDYGNGAYAETTNNGQPPPNGTPIHPEYYNPFSPAAGNRTFSLTSFGPLLWAGIPASPNSDLVNLCPSSYSKNPAYAAQTQRILDETTLLSMDLDRPGVAPYVWDPTNPGYQIVFNAAAGQKNSGYTSDGAPPTTFPNPATSLPSGPGMPPPYSDFNANTWQYAEPRVLPTLLPPGVSATPPGRIDLSRPLTPYSGTGMPPYSYGIPPNPVQAAADREQFAWDIFNKLLAVTGMVGVYNSGTATLSQQQYDTLRWLAQLSANIVDYIDTDDVMTAFQWTTAPRAPDTTGYVFGTELPKLVVNEVYMEYDNDSKDPIGKKATNPYHVNVWTELVNPLPSATDTNATAFIGVDNSAKLMDSTGKIPLYQIVLTKQNQGIRNFAQPGNVAGDPDGTGGANPPYATQPYTPGTDFDNPPGAGSQVLATFNQWGAVQNVQPLGTNTNSMPGAGSNQGFLVVGPPNPALFIGQNANTQVQIQASVQTGTDATPNNTMSYKVPTTDPNANPAAGAPVSNNLAPTVLLQRLANPYQPFNATSNPYITVDYADMNAVGTTLGKPVINDARGYDVNGQIAGAPSTPNSRVSFGRKQPYAGTAGTTAATCQWLQQAAVGALQPNDPTTTFFNVNTATAPPTVPEWLVHLDRPVVSPMELLNVSGFKPHELTQQVFDVNGKDSSVANGPGAGHVAPWLDQNMRLYRLLEFVKNKNPTPGVAPLGRVPGKININTLDPSAAEVFDALADPEPANSFGASAPYFTNLIKARNAYGPFIGMGQGAFQPGDTQYPASPYGGGAGLLNTLLTNTLGTVPPNTGLLNTSVNNRYQQMELLSKIYNNVTTRSNCFAVWLTVGFFQVTNDQTLPVKLGAEINAAQGKNIRHQMFAIVDRTQIQTWATAPPPAPPFATTAPIAAGNGQPLNLPTLTPLDYRTNRTWQIQAGTTLVYDPGVYNPNPGTPNEETVIVQPGGTANFTYPHAQGAPVISRGHPGGVPWTYPVPGGYDVKQDGLVVPYSVIID